MRALTMLALVGCYSPRVPAGAPCDPAKPSCPTGQTCVTQAGLSTCSIGAAPVDGRTDAAPDVAIDAPGIDAPPDAQSRFAYTPSIVACINPMAPNPATCAQSAVPNGIRVDNQDGTPVHTWDSFVRVDLDTAFAGRTVTAVHLRMTANTNPAANSNSSGSVYESAPFTMADLSTAEPAKRSATPLAGSQGPVALSQTVTWPLPASLATPGGSIYLELETASADAVMYWDLAGTTPPQLLVDVQ